MEKIVGDIETWSTKPGILENRPFFKSMGRQEKGSNTLDAVTRLKYLIPPPEKGGSPNGLKLLRELRDPASPRGGRRDGRPRATGHRESMSFFGLSAGAVL